MKKREPTVNAFPSLTAPPAAEKLFEEITSRDEEPLPAPPISENDEMKTICKTDIPPFLHLSNFYLSLEGNRFDAADGDSKDEEDWQIYVPVRYCKFDTVLNTEGDLFMFLSTLRYWQSETIPAVLFQKATTHPELFLGSSISEEFEKDFPFLKHLLAVANESSPIERLVIAADSGDSMLFQYAFDSLDRQQQEESLSCSRVCEAAARNGSITLLEQLMTVYHFRADRFTCEAAAAGGFLNCLEFAHENDCDWGPRTCAAAALHGHIDCLEYAFENGCTWSHETSDNASRGGHLECLRYAHHHHCDWGINSVMLAIQYGQLHCLKFLFTDGYQAPTRSRRYEETTLYCDLAAQYGNLHCLKYLRECRCPTGSSSAEKAAANGRKDCLSFLYDEDSVRATEDALTIAAYHGHYDCFVMIFERMQHPHDEDLQYAANYAAFNGHLNILQFLYSNQCFRCVTKEACGSAARNGHLDCLRYLHEHGCPWDSTTCMNAAAGGFLHCLEYAHTHGCRWNYTTCRARYFGTRDSSLQPTEQHLACLEYYHQRRSVFLGNSCLCPDYLNPIAKMFVAAKRCLRDAMSSSD